MERFVRALVAGGVVLVTGLWLAELSPPESPLRALGAGLAMVGAFALAFSVSSELEW